MKNILSILFILVSAIGFSQTRISGKISNDNDMPLNDVQIILGNNVTKTKTNKKGEFQFNNIQQGDYNLKVSYKDYLPLDTIISVNIEPIVLNLKIPQNITYLRSVNIVNHKQQEVLKNTNTHSISKEIIEKYSSKSLGDALEEVEGVSSLKTGANIVKPIINGFYGARVPIYTDNVRLEDQEWSAEHAPSVDINNYNKITVVKGGNALKYNGNSIGGMVLMESQVPLRKDSLYGKTLLTYNSNGRGGTLSTSLTKSYKSGLYFSTTLSGRISGDYQAANYNLTNTAVQNQSASFRFGVNKNKYGVDLSYSFYNLKIGILEASHIGNSRSLLTSINDHIPFVIRDFSYRFNYPYQKIQHHIIRLKSYYNFNNIGKLTFQYSFQQNLRKEYQFRIGDYEGVPSLDISLNTHASNLDFDSKKWNGFFFQTGFAGLYQTNSPNPRTQVPPIIPNYKRYDLSAYAILNYDMSKIININGAIRYDFSHVDAYKYYNRSRWEEKRYSERFPSFNRGLINGQILAYPKFDYHNVSFALGTTYHLDDKNSFIYSLGYLIRNPNSSELFSEGLHSSTGTVEIGDLGLEQEKSLKSSLTFSHQSKNFQLDVTSYFSYISNFIQLIPNGTEISLNGTFPKWYYQQNKAFIYGVDANIQWNYNRNLSQRSTVAYIYGENKTHNTPLIDMPPLNLINSITYENPAWYNFNLTIKNVTYFTQKKFPNYNYDITYVEGGQYLTSTVDISTPPKGYSLFDISAGMDFSKFLKWKKTTFNVDFSIQNVFNTSYRNYLNRQRFYADELGRNFMIQLRINY